MCLLVRSLFRPRVYGGIYQRHQLNSCLRSCGFRTVTRLEPRTYIGRKTYLTRPAAYAGWDGIANVVGGKIDLRRPRRGELS